VQLVVATPATVEWTAKSAWDAPDVGDDARPALADLDGDGDADLLIGNYTGITLAHENTGSTSSPAWTAKAAWDIADPGGALAAPALGDMDDDGDMDVLLGINSGVILGYENTGSTGSPAWTAESAWDAPDLGSLAVPALGDLDGDGDLDMMVGLSDGIAYGMENTGSSSSPAWTANAAWDSPDVGTRAKPMLADLDEDGDLDMLVGATDGISRAFENTGNATSPAWTAKTGWDSTDVGGYAAPASGDLDGDGDSDMLVGEELGSSFAYENTGTQLAYASSGTYTSVVVDAGAHDGFTTLEYTLSLSLDTAITIDARAGGTAVPDASWTAWLTDIADGGDISPLGSNRYIQYRADLSTSDIKTTPALEDINASVQNAQGDPTETTISLSTRNGRSAGSGGGALNLIMLIGGVIAISPRIYNRMRKC
jgi:hypothetical protein